MNGCAYAYMHRCVYMCLYAICRYVHICIYICMLCADIRMYICICMLCADIRMYICICMLCSDIRMYICICMLCADICMHVYIYAMRRYMQKELPAVPTICLVLSSPCTRPIAKESTFIDCNCCPTFNHNSGVTSCRDSTMPVMYK